MKMTDEKIKKLAYKNSNNKLDELFENLPEVVAHADVLISLIEDIQCPQRGFILNALYRIVGKTISQHSKADIHLIETLLDIASANKTEIIVNWVKRSKTILKDLRKYDYTEWCEGGFARKDLMY